MKQIQIQKKTQDKSFPIKLQSNILTFKPSLKKVGGSTSINVEFNSNSINTSTTVSSDKIETKTDMNNQPTNIYYDEVIFYDGGGVDGYGY
jgi:hypothetical protein